MLPKTILFFSILLWCLSLNSQITFYRIKAGITIKNKYKTNDGKEVSRVKEGVIYFDKNYKKLLSIFTFPDSETLLVDDNFSSLKKNDGHLSVTKNDIPIKSNFLFQVLSQTEKKFGISLNFYSITKVEKVNDMIVTTYKPNKKIESKSGEIIVSLKQNRLNSVLIYDRKKTLASKQYFNKYKNINGLYFPTEIVQISFATNEQLIQVTNYNNIVLNDVNGKDSYYNFTFQ